MWRCASVAGCLVPCISVLYISTIIFLFFQSGRIGRLFQGAEFFLTQIVETGAYVGIIEFSSYAFAISKLVRINTEEDRAKLSSLIPSATLNEGSDVCVGLLEALKVRCNTRTIQCYTSAVSNVHGFFILIVGK